MSISKGFYSGMITLNTFILFNCTPKKCLPLLNSDYFTSVSKN